MKFIKINFKLKMWFHENKVTLEICVYFKFSLDILIGKHRKKTNIYACRICKKIICVENFLILSYPHTIRSYLFKWVHL